MAKFYGVIGYVKLIESSPGIWEEEVTEHNYYGDILRNYRKLESSGGVNDNVGVSNEISIVADPFANENFHWMRYIEFMGSKRKIENVSAQYPRLILTIGGLYNGKQA